METIQKYLTPIVGVRIFAAWSGILTVVALANVLVLTNTVELYSNEYGNQALVWLVLLLNFGFGTAFAISAYALWQQKKWGRRLFLWTIVAWAGLNLVGLFLPFMARQQTTTQVVGSTIRYGAALLIPLWYFNMPRVKELFYANTQKTHHKETSNL